MDRFENTKRDRGNTTQIISQNKPTDRVAGLVFLVTGRYPSSIIKGYQVAKYLCCPCNPLYVLKEDTIVLVKRWDKDILSHYDKIYLDIVDTDGLLYYVRDKKIKIIVSSKPAIDYVSARLENEVIWIPEHHCNYQNELRNESEVKTVGYVGSPACFHFNFEETKEALGEIGLEFKVLTVTGTERSREEIVEFYKQIDIQLAFRKPYCINGMPPELKGPLKIYNAGSFGIPTVAYPEVGYREAKDVFLPVLDKAEIIEQCKRLMTTKSLYDDYAQKSLEFSKAFHISKTTKRYKQL